MMSKQIGKDGKEYWKKEEPGKYCLSGYVGGIKATSVFDLVPTTKGVPGSTNTTIGRPKKGTDGSKTPWTMPRPRRYNLQRK